MTDPEGPTATTKAAQINISLDHPRLLQKDSKSIRPFLRKYEQYLNEVYSHARKLMTDTVFSSTETVRPVDLKFCLDVVILESSIALDCIPDTPSYN